jgi:hypothetical protein
MKVALPSRIVSVQNSRTTKFCTSVWCMRQDNRNCPLAFTVEVSVPLALPVSLLRIAIGESYDR